MSAYISSFKGSSPAKPSTLTKPVTPGMVRPKIGTKVHRSFIRPVKARRGVRTELVSAAGRSLGRRRRNFELLGLGVLAG